MRRIKTGFICMLLLLVCCLIPGESVHAATTSKKLFTFKISDGKTTQKVPIYEYKESNGNVYVAANTSQQTLTMTASAKTAKFTISGKTSYFKKNYKSIIYTKKTTLATSKTLNLKVRTKEGALRPFKIKLLRPAISAVNVSSKTFTPGKDKLKVQLNMRSAEALKAYYKVKNSKGKVVYQKSLGTRKSTNYTTYWSGKPSKGNKAGLSASNYVPAGTYKLTGYVEYKVGTKTKYISKSVTIKVKKATTSSDTNSNVNNNTDTSIDNSVYIGWNWKMILTGDDTVDYLAEQVCQDVLTNDMTELQRARVLYNWCDKNLYHVSGQPSRYQPSNYATTVNDLTASANVVNYGKYLDTLSSNKAKIDSSDGYFGTGKGMQRIKKDWLKSGFILKKGDCLIAAAIYQTLLRHAGIEANIVENDSSAGHHFWNVVRIGGKYYYCDVDRTIYDTKLTDNTDYVYFLRGTNAFYTEKLYSTVMKNKEKYAIAKQVSATDYPNRY